MMTYLGIINDITYPLYGSNKVDTPSTMGWLLPSNNRGTIGSYKLVIHSVENGIATYSDYQVIDDGSEHRIFPLPKLDNYPVKSKSMDQLMKYVSKHKLVPDD